MEENRIMDSWIEDVYLFMLTWLLVLVASEYLKLAVDIFEILWYWILISWIEGFYLFTFNRRKVSESIYLSGFFFSLLGILDIHNLKFGFYNLI